MNSEDNVLQVAKHYQTLINKSAVESIASNKKNVSQKKKQTKKRIKSKYNKRNLETK